MTLNIPLLVFILSCAPCIASNNGLEPRAACDKTYTTCSPKGAATSSEPPLGTGLASIFVAIVETVDGAHNEKRDVQPEAGVLLPRAQGGSLCCADGTLCLLMQDYDLPFCYDNYTTNYFLPGGSYGQVTSGNYTSSDGATGNLLSGEYTMANGTIGNIYGSSADLDKPITAALPLPTQYTAAGSGSAIPATALGQEITYTSTIPGTTISPSVVSATISTLMSTNGSTTSALVTKAASTIPGTTVTPHTTTVTTMVAGSPTESGAADCFVPKRSALLGATLVGLILRHVLGLE